MKGFVILGDCANVQKKKIERKNNQCTYISFCKKKDENDQICFNQQTVKYINNI